MEVKLRRVFQKENMLSLPQCSLLEKSNNLTLSSFRTWDVGETYFMDIL